MTMGGSGHTGHGDRKGIWQRNLGEKAAMALWQLMALLMNMAAGGSHNNYVGVHHFCIITMQSIVTVR